MIRPGGFKYVDPIFSVDPTSRGGARLIHYTSRSVSVHCAVGLRLFQQDDKVGYVGDRRSDRRDRDACDRRLCELAGVGKHFAEWLADRLALAATLHPYPSNARLHRDRIGGRVYGPDRARSALRPAKERLALKLTKSRRVGIVPPISALHLSR